MSDLPEPREDGLQRSPVDQEDYLTIKDVLRHEAHEGIEVVSGFVSDNCGCHNLPSAGNKAIYKTMVLGLTPEMVEMFGHVRVAGDFRWHIHQIRPVQNHACAKSLGEMNKYHDSALTIVDRILHQLIASKMGKTCDDGIYICRGCSKHCIKGGRDGLS